MLTRYNSPYHRSYLKRDEFLAPFDAMLNDFFNHTGMSRAVPDEFFVKGRYPKCDVIEHPNFIEIKAGVPGLIKQDIKIELTEDTLSISSNLTKNTVDKATHFIKKELKQSSWRRSFFLNDSLNKESVKAKVENGLLTISIDKNEATICHPKTKSINIE